MRTVVVILLMIFASVMMYGQPSSTAVQAVTFAVSSSHHSSFVGAKSLSIPLSSENSNSAANTTAMIVSQDEKSVKKVTVALNAAMPSGVALQLRATQHNATVPVQKIVSTMPTEIITGHKHGVTELFHKIQLQYDVIKTVEAIPPTYQTVIYTVTD